MIDKVKQFIIDNELIQSNDRILIALSGGPDSICLLSILYKLKEEFNIKLGVAHVNHMLRGEESDKDEEYAKEFCNKLNIEFYSKRINIDKIANEKSISHEMAGRDERYKFFFEISKLKDYNKIAIAHNLNDQAETIIMNIMRGSGIEGLCGIRSKRENGIIRPILCLSRKEVEEYCDKYELNPRIDKTNLENIYRRNKVRLDILPYMKENFNKDIINTINRMSKLIQVDNDFLEKESNKYYDLYCLKDKSKLIISKEAFKLDKAILTRIIKKSFIDFSNTFSNFEMKHIYEIISLAENETNKKISLPNNMLALNVYGDIHLKLKNDEKINNEEIVIEKSNLNGKSIIYGDYIVNFNLINNKNNIEFSNNVLIKYLDYDKIKEKLIIRKRKNGDKIIPLGMKGSKKIKDIFIDLKIPLEQRDEIPILCFDNEIAWIVKYKVSESFKVSKETKNIIKITFTRKE